MSVSLDLRLDIGLQPKQLELLDLVENSVATNIGFGGSRGGSKSHGARSILLLRRLRYPETDGLLIRRTYKELFRNHIAPMFRQWPALRQFWHDSSKTLRLPNGSNIVFGYAEHEGDIYDFRGTEYADICAEEASHFNQRELQELKNCNRWTGSSDITCKMLFTMNPGNKGHRYIKRIFLDRQFDENEDPTDYVYLQANGWDNVEWSRKALRQDGLTAADYYSWSDEERFTYFITRSPYGKVLNALPADERKAQLMGSWDTFTSQAFMEWRRDLHVVTPFEIPSFWIRFVAMDWGFNDLFCAVWFAVSPEGDVFVYRCLSGNKRTPDQWAKQLIALTGDETLSFRKLDPSCWSAKLNAKRITQGPSIAEEFEMNGWACSPADNSRVLGWTRMHQYLAWESNPDTGLITRRPKLFFFSNCTYLIQSIPALCKDEKKPEDVAEGDDHGGDAVRYGIMTRPPLSIQPIDQLDTEWQEAARRAAHYEANQ